MVAPQRPEDFAHGWSDRSGHTAIALAELGDLARTPINLRPFQQAFRQPPARDAGKFNERPVVLADRSLNPFGLVLAYLTHTFVGDSKPVPLPERLMLEPDPPQL